MLIGHARKNIFIFFIKPGHIHLVFHCLYEMKATSRMIPSVIRHQAITGGEMMSLKGLSS